MLGGVNAFLQDRAMTTRAPRIGITLDHEPPGGYSKFPWYALRDNYCGAVAEFGGIPLPLPHEVGAVEDYLALIDGLIVTGGAFDVSPALYGSPEVHATVTTKERRTRFEWAVTEGAMQRNMPVMGICGGQQLLNVVLGGTLIQHVPDAFPDSTIAHEQPNPRNETSHPVAVVPGTRLAAIVGEGEIQVNSAHHQAADRPGAAVVINARSPDGVVEGIEHPGHRFCLGLQWHPEFLITGADRALYRAFLDACREYAAERG